MDAAQPLHKATGASRVDHILLSEARGSKQLSDHSSSNAKDGKLIMTLPDTANAERPQWWYRLLLHAGSWATWITLKTLNLLLVDACRS